MFKNNFYKKYNFLKKSISTEKTILKNCRVISLKKDELFKAKHILKKYNRKKINLAGITDKLWLPNSDLKVYLDFKHIKCVEPLRDELTSQILKMANNWTANCSVKFVSTNNFEESDISIGFKPFSGTYSYLGTDSKVVISLGKNSMNIDPMWATSFWDLENTTSFVKDYLRHAVEHEFGHALGLIHEHQREDRPFTWDIQWMKENKQLLGLNSWNAIKSNYIDVFEMPYLSHGSYDNKSTMLYSWVKKATIEKIESKIEDIFYISQGDLAQISLLYP